MSITYHNGIAVETFPNNPGTRDYHVRYKCRRVPTNRLFVFSTGVERDLYNLRGVKFVRIEQYSFTVTIGRAFTWEELEPEIKRIITEWAPRHD